MQNSLPSPADGRAELQKIRNSWRRGARHAAFKGSQGAPSSVDWPPPRLDSFTVPVRHIQPLARPNFCIFPISMLVKSFQ
jgi:hypothetical protein